MQAKYSLLRPMLHNTVFSSESNAKYSPLTQMLKNMLFLLSNAAYSPKNPERRKNIHATCHSNSTNYSFLQAKLQQNILLQAPFQQNILLFSSESKCFKNTSQSPNAAKYSFLVTNYQTILSSRHYVTTSGKQSVGWVGAAIKCFSVGPRRSKWPPWLHKVKPQNTK